MDIPLLATHFLKLICSKNGQPTPKIDAAVLKSLTQYHFPGNVRELENMLERVLALHEGDTITSDDINLPNTSPASVSDSSSPQASVAFEPSDQSIDDQLISIEKKLIQDALDKSGGNITRAAELLGTSFRSLRYKIKKLEIN
jgi:two-component system response regulator PilR (NtrC family)